MILYSTFKPVKHWRFADVFNVWANLKKHWVNYAYWNGERDLPIYLGITKSASGSLMSVALAGRPLLSGSASSRAPSIIAFHYAWLKLLSLCAADACHRRPSILITLKVVAIVDLGKSVVFLFSLPRFPLFKSASNLKRDQSKTGQTGRSNYLPLALTLSVLQSAFLS